MELRINIYTPNQWAILSTYKNNLYKNINNIKSTCNIYLIFMECLF